MLRALLSRCLPLCHRQAACGTAVLLRQSDRVDDDDRDAGTDDKDDNGGGDGEGAVGEGN